jgi:hypothetical protein
MGSTSSFLRQLLSEHLVSCGGCKPAAPAIDVTLMGGPGIAAWLLDREQQKIGEQKQAYADFKADLAVAQRVNAAEANAPQTDAQWQKAAEEGKL